MSSLFAARNAKKGEDKKKCVMSDEKALQCCAFLTFAFFSNCNVKIIVKNNVLFKKIRTNTFAILSLNKPLVTSTHRKVLGQQRFLETCAALTTIHPAWQRI